MVDPGALYRNGGRVGVYELLNPVTLSFLAADRRDGFAAEDPLGLSEVRDVSKSSREKSY